MGTVLVIVGSVIAGSVFGLLGYLALGPRKARRAANDDSARCGPNPTDGPREMFWVKALINDPPISLRGGDPASLYISADHIGVTAHGLFDRVLVCAKGDEVRVALAGTREPRRGLRLSTSDGHASILLPGNAEAVAHALSRFGWDVEQMWS